ncbi:MAG TPA: nuclear transport factor 2 family protein [Myxococcota bacterium]|nr:nuclear transport factor 2 family protein [Myxococcota bacterium]
MIEHANSLLVYQCIQAVQRGDSETLRALWADDIVWHVQGASPWHGPLRGPDAILEYLAQTGEIGSGYDTSIDDVLISHDRAAILCHVKAELDGRLLETDSVLICRIEHRRIQEVVSTPLAPERVAEFWQQAEPGR